MKGVITISIVCGLLFSSTHAQIPVGGMNIPASAAMMPSALSSNPALSIGKSSMDSTDAVGNYLIDWINLFFAISGLDAMGFSLDKNSDEGFALKALLASFFTSLTGMSVMAANPVGAVVGYVTPMMTLTCDMFNDLKDNAK